LSTFQRRAAEGQKRPSQATKQSKRLLRGTRKMNRAIRKQRKKSWFRTTIWVLGVWFVMQANPVFPACLEGRFDSAHAIHTGSEKRTCCCDTAPMKPLQVEPSRHHETESLSSSSDSGADACSPCCCLAKVPVGNQSSFTLTLSGAVPVPLAFAASNAPYRSIDLKRDSFPNPPRRPTRSTPLFLLKSSLLI
jgi:hypothetical protein